MFKIIKLANKNACFDSKKKKINNKREYIFFMHV